MMSSDVTSRQGTLRHASTFCWADQRHHASLRVAIDEGVWMRSCRAAGQHAVVWQLSFPRVVCVVCVCARVCVSEGGIHASKTGEWVRKKGRYRLCSEAWRRLSGLVGLRPAGALALWPRPPPPPPRVGRSMMQATQFSPECHWKAEGGVSSGCGAGDAMDGPASPAGSSGFWSRSGGKANHAPSPDELCWEYLGCFRPRFRVRIACL